MRLASLLPMLLLAFSVPIAAQNCQIFDLTATVAQVNPQGCQYFVSLTFQHNGTSNQYTVTGNGTNYGIFPYTQVPLILGPFNGSPNGPTHLEFNVSDVVFQDCHDLVQIDLPACVNNSICNITNLAVQTGVCSPSGQTYNLWVNFQVSGATSDFFEVFANGVSIGLFPIGGLPLQIPAFPASGNLIDVISVCIANNPNCCETLQFQAPDCVNNLCPINDLSVHTGACTSDSTYKAIINFGITGPIPTDTFSLWSNGLFVGNFGINQLPLTQEIKWDGGLKDEVKVCLFNAGVTCCKSVEYAVPNCLFAAPCGIYDLVVKADTCTSDSTFHLVLNFAVNDPTAVDSFDLWANGDHLGHYGMNQLPLSINDLHWNGLIFSHVRVCTGNLPACCKEYQFLNPSCLPYEPCKITDIFLHTGDCTSDSTYNINLNFNGTNPGNGTFTVSIHNQLIDTFNLSQLPLTLEVPWNGQAGDFVTICILDTVPGAQGCCRVQQFQVPTCILPCSIFDLVVDPGACHPNDSTYDLTLNFQTVNPGNNQFEVWGNGTYLGAYPLSSLPLTLHNFPSNGNAVDIIKVCINDHPDCCKTIDFQGPNCDAPCHIFDVSVIPGDCDPNSNTYHVTLNFGVNNPGNSLFEVWGNGTYLGLFPLAGLPMIIPNFPSNGNAIDVIKICINDHPDCCETIEFQGPTCNAPCEIFDLSVVTGDCNTPDSSYQLTVNFQVQNPSSNTFGLWANGVFFGSYDLNQLPLYIPNFPWDGTGPNDLIKVCLTTNNGSVSCCRSIEFPSPNCFPQNCAVENLVVQTGDCTGDSTYQVVVNFQAINPPGDNFSLWANGQFFGIFNVNQLPLTIQQFPWNGGIHDLIKVCFTNAIGGQGACCAEVEFAVPGCLFNNPCDIFDLTAIPGDCNPNDPTYHLTINFGVNNPGNLNFHVTVNGIFYGSHALTSLPYTIPNVASNGNAIDVVEVCINDHPNCCEALQFVGPNCNGNGPCEIFDVVLDPGDCNPASTSYPLHLNFQVQNPGSDFYEVWGNGVNLGVFPLAGLPTIIPNFPSNGPAIDVIKICIQGNPDCCRTIEFHGPDCGNVNCEIFDLNVHAGACTSNTTYELNIHFQVQNPPSNMFQVWHNGQIFGTYNVNQLPLSIPNFPSNGGPTDVIKICMVWNPPGNSPCCREAIFDVPNCMNGDCHIYDLAVLKTPCLCGQFFAILTFKHENGGGDGFDIFGNGNNYGNFPYNTVQPIILGPFPGDGTTMYEFVVRDHNHPDLCFDHFNLGKVDCMVPVIDPGHGSAMLSLSPNPTANWLNVTALLDNGASIGQADVKVYAADGRLAQSNTVSNGANFQLDVSSLPSGLYRIVLLSDSGRLEGTFAKQ